MKKSLFLCNLLFLASFYVQGQSSNPKKAVLMNNIHRNDKLTVYQVMTHLWGNANTANQFNGTLTENGVGKFTDFSDHALNKIQEFGYSHIYFTGIIRHATTEDYSHIGIPTQNPVNVKGRCGAPFAITDYYDVNPFLATEPAQRMTEFETMVKRCHQHNIKVIIDCIPNHVAREYKSIAKPRGIKDFGETDSQQKGFDPQNNFYYLPNKVYNVPSSINASLSNMPYHEMPAKVTGNDVFSESPSINDWFETVKLNYGVDYLNSKSKHFDPTPSTWLKMKDILLFWAAKGVDGFRCDMAEMVPVEFWGWVIPEVKKQYPSVIFIAEIYNPQEYHNYINVGKFDYLYDKVGLYDALRRLMEGKPEATVADITKCWQQETGDIAANMLRFLENHDEQRITSDFFAKDPWTAVPAMVVTATMNTGPIMIYFGQESGEKAMDAEGFGSKDGRTTMFDYWGVTEHQKWYNNGQCDGGLLSPYQKKLALFYANLLRFSTQSEAISKGHFYDLQFANINNSQGYDERMIYSYLRYTANQKLLFICNFNRQKEYQTEVVIPAHAWETMGLKPTEKHQFIDISGTSSNQIIEGNNPLKISLPSLAVHIFEIK
jgi:glycosidase